MIYQFLLLAASPRPAPWIFAEHVPMTLQIVGSGMLREYRRYSIVEIEQK
jgi:hypothetical protein